MPCEIDTTIGKFGTGHESYILNNLHSTFNQITVIASQTNFMNALSSIDTKNVVKKEFLNRDELIADYCDYCIYN